MVVCIPDHLYFGVFPALPGVVLGVVELLAVFRKCNPAHDKSSVIRQEAWCKYLWCIGGASFTQIGVGIVPEIFLGMQQRAKTDGQHQEACKASYVHGPGVLQA
jgi:hypothetical protein